MGALGDALSNAQNRRGANRYSVLENLLKTLDPADSKELALALEEFDASRAVWRVSSRQVAEILVENGFDISPSTISTYRAKHRFREIAEAKAPASNSPL